MPRSKRSIACVSSCAVTDDSRQTTLSAFFHRHDETSPAPELPELPELPPHQPESLPLPAPELPAPVLGDAAQCDVVPLPGDATCDASPEQHHITATTLDAAARTCGAAEPCVHRDRDVTDKVTCLKDIFLWARYDMDVLDSYFGGDVASHLYSTIGSIGSWSSSFSGVSADTVSMNMMITEINRRKGWMPDASCCHPTYKYAIEYDTQATHELVALPHGPEHIFDNILTFASPSLTRHFNAMSEPYCFDEMMREARKPNAVTTEGYCKRRNRMRSLVRTDGHACSCPCTDFTVWGSCRRLTGPTAPILAIWIALMLVLLPAMIFCENVELFPEGILERYMGFAYDVVSTVVDNVQFGHCVRRRRKYIVLLLRGALTLSKPLHDMHVLFGRERSSTFTMNDLFIAGEGELHAELVWARSRSDDCKREQLSGSLSRDDFYGSLKDTERDRHRIFLHDHNGADKIITLSQDPDFVPMMSSTQVLNTMVRNVHLQWSEFNGRWMSARELFLGQTFPVTQQSLDWLQPGRPGGAQPLCSFNISRVAAMLPPRCRVSMAHQAGNSQCTNVVGAIYMFVFAFRQACVCSVPASLGDGHLRETNESWADSASTSVAAGVPLWRKVRGKACDSPRVRPASQVNVRGPASPQSSVVLFSPSSDPCPAPEGVSQGVTGHDSAFARFRKFRRSS